MIFQNSNSDLLSRFQGKPLDGITLKLICTWNNHHSENLLWNYINSHGVITKTPIMCKKVHDRVLLIKKYNLSRLPGKLANGIS